MVSIEISNIDSLLQKWQRYVRDGRGGQKKLRLLVDAVIITDEDDNNITTIDDNITGHRIADLVADIVDAANKLGDSAHAARMRARVAAVIELLLRQ